MHALVFLDTRVLTYALPGSINAVRADKTLNVPVVITREEVAAVLSRMDGTAPVVAKLLYGSGLRRMAALRLRGKALDVQMTPLTVRSGQGDQDRCTTVPAILTPVLQHHLAGVKTRHQQDLAQGHGEVYLPHALARKHPNAVKAWGWQYVFPARHLAADPRFGLTWRHHVDPSVINQAITVAVRRAGLTKHISARTVAVPAPPTCRNAAPTSAPFSHCSGTTMWPPPCSTPTSCNRVAKAFRVPWTISAFDHHAFMLSRLPNGAANME
jgi:integrase